VHNGHCEELQESGTTTLLATVSLYASSQVWIESWPAALLAYIANFKTVVTGCY
jgi:hypothetical protein